MDRHWCSSRPLEACGGLWILVDGYWCLWITMDSHWYLWRSMGANGWLLVLMDGYE